MFSKMNSHPYLFCLFLTLKLFNGQRLLKNMSQNSWVWLVADWYSMSMCNNNVNTQPSWERRQCIELFACMHAKSLESCQTLCGLCTVARQPPLSMGFSRQEYWRGGCHAVSQGIFPTQGLNCICIGWRVLYH